MRYVEVGRFGSVWGRRKVSSVITISAMASRTTADPTVVLGISVFDEENRNDYDVAALVGGASIELSPEQVRRFAERLVTAADESEERSRRFRYAREVKEVLS
jgi:hypothetical protein